MGQQKRHPKKQPGKPTPSGSAGPVAGLRIIGGYFRGRKLEYSGDLRTRPMKDRLREAIFNLLGPTIRGKHALDLFAGTGALALEAVSRGADRATLIEQHYPSANIIRRNIDVLGLQQKAEVFAANVFIWAERHILPVDSPWAVFCSPPYDFYASRREEMLELIVRLIEQSPLESAFVVEADQRFDFQTLPNPDAWDVRAYPPAVVGIYWKDFD